MKNFGFHIVQSEDVVQREVDIGRKVGKNLPDYFKIDWLIDCQPKKGVITIAANREASEFP